MGKIYARKIMETTDGSYSIKDVPEMWLQKTIDAFKFFVKNNTITPEQYKQYVGEDYTA